MPMYSAWDTLAGGFPHSEILGSKLVWQLPEAYRSLQRLSSPVIAKASTICTYSLDSITLVTNHRYLTSWSVIELLTTFADEYNYTRILESFVIYSIT